MIELHNMLNGFTKVQKDQLFEMRDNVQISYGKCLPKFFTLFTKSVTNENKLPLEVKTAQDTTFKIYYGKDYQDVKKQDKFNVKKN
jgi:hypothetical protein